MNIDELLDFPAPDNMTLGQLVVTYLDNSDFRQELRGISREEACRSIKFGWIDTETEDMRHLPHHLTVGDWKRTPECIKRFVSIDIKL